MNSPSIDLRYLLEASRRQYVYFLSVLIICLVWSYSSFRLSKPNWSASFLINVEKQNASGTRSNSLGQYAGLFSKSASTDVLTEAQILQSPLVLKSVFDYAKSLLDQDSDVNFSEWVQESINLQNIEGTSILKVTFSADNKQHVVPVLSRIISSYTAYGRDEKRNRTSNMLRHNAKVVAELRSISDQSSRKLDSFVLRHGISGDSPTANFSSIPSTGSFGSFFLRVETSRKTTTHALSKNVQNSLSFYKAALYLIPLLEKHCNLSTKSRVLDYGSGGLRNGYGLLEYLDADCYSCADITTEFLDLALKNSPVLDHLSTAKGLTFYNLHSDPIPANYFDIVVSTYVLPHIPPEQLDSYFSDISSSLSGNGLAYLDFIPALKLLKLNSTTYLYPYRYILPILKKHDLKIVGEYGFSLILAQA